MWTYSQDRPDLGHEQVEEGCRSTLHVYNPHLLEIVARRPTYVRLALWFLHHPAWMDSHTGRADFGQEAVGGLCSSRAQ